VSERLRKSLSLHNVLATGAGRQPHLPRGTGGRYGFDLTIVSDRFQNLILSLSAIPTIPINKAVGRTGGIHFERNVIYVPVRLVCFTGDLFAAIVADDGLAAILGAGGLYGYDRRVRMLTRLVHASRHGEKTEEDQAKT
jgi:hypothetical protein